MTMTYVVALWGSTHWGPDSGSVRGTEWSPREGPRGVRGAPGRQEELGGGPSGVREKSGRDTREARKRGLRGMGVVDGHVAEVEGWVKGE